MPKSILYVWADISSPRIYTRSIPQEPGQPIKIGAEHTGTASAILIPLSHLTDCPGGDLTCRLSMESIFGPGWFSHGAGFWPVLKRLL